jgi:integrase
MSQKMFTKKQIQSATEPYREFANEDIRALFKAEYLHEMSSPTWYWVPLISLYSGARLGEVCNLQVITFEIVDDIKVFLVGNGKNDASKRTVPIHSKLLRLGLWEYAQGLKDRGCTHMLPHEPAAYRTKSVGRKWGNWVAKCGIHDDNKTFHSFRSTAITDMHNADEAQAGHAAIQRSVGHATPGTSGSHGKYIRGIKLRKLQSAIESVDHDDFDVSHLRLEDPTFTAFFDRHFAFVNSPGEIARKQRRENHRSAKAQRLAIDKKK